MWQTIEDEALALVRKNKHPNKKCIPEDVTLWPRLQSPVEKWWLEDYTFLYPAEMLSFLGRVVRLRGCIDEFIEKADHKQVTPSNRPKRPATIWRVQPASKLMVRAVICTWMSKTVWPSIFSGVHSCCCTLIFGAHVQIMIEMFHSSKKYMTFGWHCIRSPETSGSFPPSCSIKTGWHDSDIWELENPTVAPCSKTVVNMVMISNFNWTLTTRGKMKV